MIVRCFFPAALRAGVLLLAFSAPALADDQAETRRPGEIAREGVETLLREFDKFVESIPQYALPEVNEQGDVIIRRKNPPPRETHNAPVDVLEL